MISCGLDLAVESHALRRERYGIFLSESRFLNSRSSKGKKENFSQALSILYKHEFNPCPSLPSVTTDNRKQVRWLINESLKRGGGGRAIEAICITRTGGLHKLELQ